MIGAYEEKYTMRSLTNAILMCLWSIVVFDKGQEVGRATEDTRRDALAALLSGTIS
jgi:hypothetical protein